MSIEKSPDKMEGGFRSEYADDMEQAAAELGLPFQRVAGPGEIHSLKDGIKIVVPRKMVYVEVTSYPAKGLKHFWQRVEELGLARAQKLKP